MGTEVGPDDIAAAGGTVKLKIESNKPGAPDVSQHKAPSYRVRKSIVTARVKLGATSQIFEKYDLTEDVLGTGTRSAPAAVGGCLTADSIYLHHLPPPSQEYRAQYVWRSRRIPVADLR